MSKYFQIKNCPLCQKPLYAKWIDWCTVSYRCPTFAPSPKWNLNLTIPHYEVLLNNSDPPTATQTTIVPPFVMETKSGTGRTQIYKWYQHDTVEKNFIMEIPTLLPDRESEKMVKRIEGLILFS